MPSDRERERFARYKIPILVAVAVIVAFCAGLALGRNESPAANAQAAIPAALADASSSADLGPFWTVWNILQQKFVNAYGSTTPTTQDKIWGAIEGLTASYGDPYTVFMPPSENADFQSNISGDFGGVGMELGAKDGTIVVIAPLKDTPAYDAGIKSGDILLSIDGTSTENMDVDTAVNLIRGDPGTKVALSFERGSSTKPLDFTITRSTINIPTVDTETQGDVFIIHLYNFYAPSADDFRNALRQFVQSGDTKLVIDVRGNPGGYLDAAVDIASWFLPQGDVVVREDYGPNIPEDVYRSKGYSGVPADTKIVVLADQGSASAAEILSGALQDHGRAVLVGTRTFGKGSVQELLPITSDTSLKVTIARWLTPDGVSISEHGLTPNYDVPITSADVAAGKDPQMAKAIQLLNQ